MALTGAALPAMTSADSPLVERVLAGDVAAFEALMRRYNRVLFRTARAILRDDAEAEDAVQEAQLLAYRSLTTFRGDARFSSWLTRIVANEAFARLRKRARRAAILPLHVDEGEGVDSEVMPEASPMDQPDHRAMREEMRRLIESRIDALPDSYRAVFVLRAVEELSVEETATSLGIPEATVRSRFFRARNLLREALSLDVDRAYGDAFGFAGERCDRIVANVMARLAAHADGRD